MKTRLIGVWILSVVFLIGFPSICRGEEVKLMFPKIESTERKSPEGKSYFVFSKKEQYEKSEYTEKSLSEFVKEFENQRLKVDQIELWVEGREESGGITRLYVSMDGGRGYKVIIRPRSR